MFSDTVADPDFSLFDINEGELAFLTTPPNTPPYEHTTHVTISADSLKTGWIANKQCHYNLDQVGRMQVVFRKGYVRDLRVLRADNITRVWVDGHTVQLTDVGRGAVLCLIGEVRSLQRNPVDGSYEWQGGPYMRRFLDGYFPMRLKLALDYPQALQLESVEPSALQLNMIKQPGHVRINALFEGRLTVTMRLVEDGKDAGIGW